MPAPSRDPLRRWCAAAFLLAIGCGAPGAGRDDVAARAGGRELTVDAAARLLAANPKLPADSFMARALAEVWVDYALLAAAARDDSTLASLDLDVLVRPAREQAIIRKLRDRVVRADTVFTDEEVAARLRAHGDTSAAARGEREEEPERYPGENEEREREREKVRERERVRAAMRGEPLKALTADELDEERRNEFRHYMAATVMRDAEGAYVDSLTDAVAPRVAADAPAAMRAIAASPGIRPRDGAKALVTYQGGSLTVAEYHDFVRTQPAHIQGALAGAPEAQLQNAALQLVQRKLLLTLAAKEGITLSADEERALAATAREDVTKALHAAGITRVAALAAPAAPRDSAVDTLLARSMARVGKVVPLERLAVALRARYESEVRPAALPRVVERLRAERGESAAPTARRSS
jgi:hypothetical protein